MRTVKRTITTEQYNTYKAMTPAEQKEAIENTVPIEWWCGYGYYGYDLYPDHIEFTIGSTCD